MKKVRVGVVGVGFLGQHHARIYADLPNVDLIGVTDQESERAVSVASRYGCRAFSNPGSLFEEVDAISLAVPTRAHVTLGVEAFEKGLHVLVEKPLAPTLAGADQLIEAASDADRILHVGHSERFNPVLSAVRPYIKDPRFFEAHRLGVFVPRSLDVDVVLDLMIHDLDIVLSLVQKPIVEIRAVGIPILTSRVDIANARIEFQNGCVANLTASRVSRDKVRKLRFFQAHDYISLDFHRRSVEMYSLAEKDGRRDILERHPEVEAVEPLRRELVAFLEAVNGGPARSACTGWEGRSALAAALEVLSVSRRSRSL